MPTISPTTRANAKLHILDTFGVALAGVDQPAAKIALDYCAKTRRLARSIGVGHAAKGICPTAAFANGLLAHALDFDDWDAFIHVGHPTSMFSARR